MPDKNAGAAAQASGHR